MAKRIHERTGQTIAWHTFGINGIRLGALIRELETTELPEADVVLLSMGVNDTTGFTPRFRFRRELRELLAPRYSGPMLLLSVPPMHLFTALPSPLRYVVGWRARQLDNLYIRLRRRFPADFRYVNYPVVTDPELLASDGYHPGQWGYQYIAEALVAGELLGVGSP